MIINSGCQSMCSWWLLHTRLCFVRGSCPSCCNCEPSSIASLRNHHPSCTHTHTHTPGPLPSDAQSSSSSLRASSLPLALASLFFFPNLEQRGRKRGR